MIRRLLMGVLMLGATGALAAADGRVSDESTPDQVVSIQSASVDAASGEAVAVESATDALTAATTVAPVSLANWREALERGHVAALLAAIEARQGNAREGSAPGEREVAWARAFALAAASRHPEAIEAFDAALAVTDGVAYELREGRAASLRLAGEREEAWRERQRIVSDFQRESNVSADAMVAVGQASRALGRRDSNWYRNALEIFELAARTDPESVRPVIALAELLLDRYNSQEAVEVLAARLQGNDAPHPGVLHTLARIQHFDQSRAAGQTVDAILERDPEFRPALLLRARLYMEAERYELAARDIEAAIALNAADLDALALRASLAFLEADGKVFEADVSQSRTLAPGSARVFSTLAETAARNRRYDAAVQFALGAISVDRYEWRAYVLLGVNRMRQGDMDGGRRALEAAFEGDPFNVWAKNTLDLLDKVKDFSVHRSEHFILSAPADEGPVLAPYLLPIAEEAFATFVARYGHTPRTPIRIEMYATHEDFSVRTAGVVGLGILGVSFGPVVALDSPSAGAFGPLNWASVLWHEIAHSFHLSMSRHQAPRWFSEGLAVYEERAAREGWGADPSPDFLRAWAQERLPPPSGLNEVFLRPEYPQQVVHGYTLGSLLIEYMVERGGFEAINAMLAGFAARESFPDLAVRQLGVTPDELDEDFSRWLNLRFAAPLASLVATDTAPEGIYLEHLRAGAKALSDKDWALAERELTLAHAAFPEHAGPDSAMDLLAILAEAREDLADAVTWLQRSIAIDADDIRGHRRLAAHLLALDRHEEAAEVLGRSVLIEPFDANVHRRLAEAGEARGDWARAVMGRQAVANLSPADPVVAGEQLARAQMMTGDTGAARTTLLHALERAPLHERGLELLLELRTRAGTGAATTTPGETQQ